MASIYEPNWNCFGFNSMKSYTPVISTNKQ